MNIGPVRFDFDPPHIFVGGVMSPMNIGGHPHRFHFSFVLAHATTILFLPFPSRSPTPLVATYIHRCLAPAAATTCHQHHCTPCRRRLGRYFLFFYF
jgi:hypothetical protein